MTDRVEAKPSSEGAQVAKKTRPKVPPQSLEMLLAAFGDGDVLDESDKVEDALTKLSQIHTDDITNGELSLLANVFKFFIISG